MRITSTSSPFSGAGTIAEIDLFENLELTAAQKAEASRDVGEYLVSQINQYLNGANTPVSGGSYKSGLSSEYRAFKRDQGGSSVADLELTGTMRDSLTYRVTPTGVQVGVFGNNRNSLKADGHNNYSGRSTLPRRQFLPDRGQNFKAQITRGVESILAAKKVQGGPVALSGLSQVQTRAEFNDWISTQFPNISRTQVSRALLSDPAAVNTLENLGFLKWLRV